ncbi:unnamed protein product [Closterium sp. NIES-64]|nr:unnamed protein product [Closterium sp. NIES-64]
MRRGESVTVSARALRGGTLNHVGVGREGEGHPFLAQPEGGLVDRGVRVEITPSRSGGHAEEALADSNKPVGADAPSAAAAAGATAAAAVVGTAAAGAAVKAESGEVQIERMLAGLSHLARFLRLQQQAQEPEAQLLEVQQREAEAKTEAEAEAGAEAEARAGAGAGEAVLSTGAMARLQMGGSSKGERQQLMALLRALKQAEEPQLSQQSRRKRKHKENLKQEEKEKQSLCNWQKGQRAVSQEQPGFPQAPKVQQQPQEQQQQQQQLDGGEEEHWLSAFSALPEAGASAKQVETALASTFAPRYGPDGTERLARGGGGWGRMGKRAGERNSSHGGSDGGSGGGGGIGSGSSHPKFALHGSATNPSSAMSTPAAVRNSHVTAGTNGIISSSLFSSTATNSANDAGKRRKRPSPGGPSGRATVAHTPQQHPSQTPRACYIRSALGPASASFVQPNPEEPPAVGASILGAAMIVDPHIPVPDVRGNQKGVLEGVCTREYDVALEPTQKSPRDERARAVRFESETNGRAYHMHDECYADDALDYPKGREHCNTQGECSPDDGWLPRCQGIRGGSAPNQRIKRRSMAERRRRERISEGLQRLRAKVRGRGDTCAMLDRAVGYVDSLERRVMELEKVIVTAAGSGRNVLPGHAFAIGGAFDGNSSANDAVALRATPGAAVASVSNGLGSAAAAGWPWE